MRKFWPLAVKIYWDPWKNVPIIKPTQEEIDLLYHLRLSAPSDARPAFPGDIEKLRKAVTYEFGSDKIYRHLIEGRLVLLNKVPHWDLMYEVAVSGNVVGQLYYDPYSRRWRFRLTYQGAYLAVGNGLVDTVVASPPFYSGKVLKTNTSSSAREVVVVDPKGGIRAVGEVLAGGEVVVSKTYHDRTPPVETSNKPAGIYDLVKCNEKGLAALEEKSIKFLQRLSRRYSGLKPVVSYSGGKDSLVALDLAHKSLGNVDILFNDTGLEMPETLKNVEQVAEFYNSKLYVASAGDIFWRAVEVFGPPGKDYRWCCKITKLVPIAKLSKSVWPGGGLNIVGQRAYESLDRASSPLVWRNKWIRHMVSTTPIQYWSQLATWTYVFKHKLPYNKLYEHGFDRLGCFMCPSCALAEFEETKNLYPELWTRWERVLTSWKNRMALPDEWINLGLWRWLTPSTAKRRITHHIPEYRVDWKDEYARRLEESRICLVPTSTSRDGARFRITFNDNLLDEKSVKTFASSVSNVGFRVASTDPLVLEKNETRFTISGNFIDVEEYSEDVFEDLVDMLKLIFRARGCVYCGSCVLWVRRGSVTLTSSGPLVKTPLTEEDGRLYIEVCPISDQLVEKVVLPLIVGDYKVFKRKTRRRV